MTGAVRGTNVKIGRAIGMLARDRYRQSAAQYRTDPMYDRAWRRYFERAYPIHWGRLRGVVAT